MKTEEPKEREETKPEVTPDPPVSKEEVPGPAPEISETADNPEDTLEAPQKGYVFTQSEKVTIKDVEFQVTIISPDRYVIKRIG